MKPTILESEKDCSIEIEIEGKFDATVTHSLFETLQAMSNMEDGVKTYARSLIVHKVGSSYLSHYYDLEIEHDKGILGAVKFSFDALPDREEGYSKIKRTINEKDSVDLFLFDKRLDHNLEHDKSIKKLFLDWACETMVTPRYFGTVTL
jgi:hypothetical protein